MQNQAACAMAWGGAVREDMRDGQSKEKVSDAFIPNNKLD